ncbi:MAG: hypothetical protein M3362_19110 [Acidobacteriota bacterium]|nr:hypothetical protein [Acidobacteriota bacterium]
MTTLLQKALRELGDEGADTLGRYFAQIEYTGFLCIRMLRTNEGILGVIPEGGDDVVVVRLNINELHQVKTRNESRGPWTTAIILPILCHQYHRRILFPDTDCEYHFVSDQMADTKTALTSTSFGALFDLKTLLEANRFYGSLEPEEQVKLAELEKVILPRIQEILKNDYGENISEEEARNLLYRTSIETNNLNLRNPNNLEELEEALYEICPTSAQYSTDELREIYDRILLLIVRKIIRGKSLDERRIGVDDILNCRVEPQEINDGLPDLTSIPGRTLMDKKAILGGFATTELSLFHRQRLIATSTLRELEILNLQKPLDRLTVALLDLQRRYLHKVCREQGYHDKPGPRILNLLQQDLSELASRYFPDVKDIDDLFCMGVLWRETELCNAWWHSPERIGQEP